MKKRKIVLALLLLCYCTTVESTVSFPSVEEISNNVIKKLRQQNVIPNKDTIRSIVQEILDEQLISTNNDFNGIDGNTITKTISIKGEKGDSIKGIRGRTGLPGVMGLRGVKGDRGSAGHPGENGENGRPGLNGLKGSPAAKGDTGEIGPPGLNGKDGVNCTHEKYWVAGEAGTSGSKSNGEKGERGEKGNVGKDGPEGLVGVDGVQGTKGEQGEQGEMGPQGRRGNTGPIGPSGPKGESITGPRGPKGDMGPPGPPSVVPIHARPAKVVSGERGPPGNNGTKGEKGDHGPIGARGPVGPMGPSGRLGAPGKDGKGEKGESGVPGKDGEFGYTGDQGPRGIPGLKGERGEKGDSPKMELLSQKAHVLFTTHDLDLMVDMFPTGSLVLISSTDEMYVRAITGWLQLATSKSIASTNPENPLEAAVAGPNIQGGLVVVESMPTPSMLDRRLIDGHLAIPKAGVVVERPYLLLMALNHPMSGNMGSVSGADRLCFDQANELHLDGGTFRAFLSDRYLGINRLVSRKYTHLPIANIKGERIFDSYLSITNTSGYAAFNPSIPIYSFNLRDVRLDNTWPIKKIWHGSHAHGEVHRAGHPCKNWRSDNAAKKATAASIMSFTPALNEEFVRCDKHLITLCIQHTLT